MQTQKLETPECCGPSTSRPMPCSRRVWLRSGCAASLVAALPPLGLAQGSRLDKPVRIVVPYTAGGGSDNIARALCTELSRELGQPVVVDNKPGASAMLGAELVARAAPDGYTLLLADMPHTITPSLYKTPYDALKAVARVEDEVALRLRG